MSDRIQSTIGEGELLLWSLQSEFFHDQKVRLSKAFSSPGGGEVDWADTSSEEEEVWGSLNGGRSHSPQSGSHSATLLPSDV